MSKIQNYFKGSQETPNYPKGIDPTASVEVQTSAKKQAQKFLIDLSTKKVSRDFKRKNKLWDPTTFLNKLLDLDKSTKGYFSCEGKRASSLKKLVKNLAMEVKKQIPLEIEEESKDLNIVLKILDALNDRYKNKSDDDNDEFISKELLKEEISLDSKSILAYSVAKTIKEDIKLTLAQCPEGLTLCFNADSENEYFLKRETINKSTSKNPVNIINNNHNKYSKLNEDQSILFYLNQLSFSKSINIFDLRKVNKKLVELNPDSENGWLGLGLNLPPNEKEEALKSLDKCLKINPNNIKALEAKGNLLIDYRNPGDYDKAILNLKQAIKLGSKNPQTFANLSKIYIWQNKYANATKLLEKAINSQINSSIIYKSLGKIYYRQQYTGENGTRMLKKALGYYLKASQAKDADLVNCHEEIGDCYYNMDDFEKALEHYSLYLEFNSTYPSTHRKMGDCLKEQKEYEKAIIAYRQSLDITPDFLYSLKGMGLCYQKLELYSLALDCYQKVAALDFDKGKKLINKLQETIVRNLEGKNPDEAIKLYQRILEIMPDNSCTLNQLGLCYQKLELYGLALDCYQKVAALDFDKGKKLINKLQETIVRNLEDKNPDEAIKLYQRMLEIMPDDSCTLNQIGTVFHNFKKDYKTSIKYFKKAVENNPKQPQIFSNIGITLYQQKNYGQAIAHFKKAIEISHSKENKYFVDNFNLYKHYLYSLSKIKINSDDNELDFDSELRRYKQSIERLGRDGRTKEILTKYFFQAKVAFHFDQTNEIALQLVNKAIEIYNDSPAYTALRAKIYEALGETEKQIEDLEKLLKLDPDAKTYHQLSILLEIRDSEKSKIYMAKALELDPNLIKENYLSQAQIYDDESMSIEDLNMSLALAVDLEKESKLLEKIKNLESQKRSPQNVTTLIEKYQELMNYYSQNNQADKALDIFDKLKTIQKDKNNEGTA